MWCCKCVKQISNCTCEDLEIRLDSCDRVVYKKCIKCQKHYERCRCENPEYEIKGIPEEVSKHELN